MNESRLIWVVLAAATMLAWSGARGEELVKPPATIAEYEASARLGDSKSFPPNIVRMYNLQRTMDNDLALPARIESLHLTVRLSGNDPAALDQIAMILSDPRTPPEMQKAVLEYLLRGDRPGLAGHAVRALSSVKAGSPLRVAVLDWLTKNGDASMLADVVKAWAQERINGEDETRFRRVVEKITGMDWERSLLEGINTEAFFARGSAMEVLAGRVAAAALIRKVNAMTAKTEAMAALKSAIIELDYLPADGVTLLTTVSIYRSRTDVFKDAARLSRQWQNEYAYSFNIRDFYLLSRLSGDPLRPNLRRDDLVTGITTALSRRAYVPRAEGARDSDVFSKQVTNLTMADLWNLYLLNQMLMRPRVTGALKVMAERDRADARSAWGGLVIYDGGQAEARLYPPEKDAQANDLKYAPGRQLIVDSREAICRFVGHFEKAANSSRAGPTPAELSEARAGNYYGLVVTSVSNAEFCAHYYNPAGIAISLGRFTYGR